MKERMTEWERGKKKENREETMEGVVMPRLCLDAKSEAEKHCSVFSFICDKYCPTID